MKSFWRGVKEKMEQDPHFIPVMGIESEGGKGCIVQQDGGWVILNNKKTYYHH